MAKEMMGYTKNNILVQASQAMLAQANTIPQGVLQLLHAVEISTPLTVMEAEFIFDNATAIWFVLALDSPT